MIFKVVSIALLTICAAENRLIMPKRLNPQPIVPHRFNRQNIPISYKYGEVHHYSTPHSLLRTGHLIPSFYQGIQYAPLQGRSGQKNKNSAGEYTKVTPTLSSAPTTQTESLQSLNRNVYRKDHLEPRVRTGQEEPVFKCYSPRHKVEVLSSVSRSPGHNAVYRTFPEVVSRDKPFKINYNIKPFGVYQNLEALTTTMLPFDLPQEHSRPVTFSNQHYVVNPNLIESTVIEKTKRQYSPYAKFHRLHLNIARVYSPGQVPQKTPVFTDTYSLNLGKFPIYSETNLPPLFQALSDQKTVLYPTKNNQKNYHFRLP